MVLLLKSPHPNGAAINRKTNR